eukprot:6103165-Prymnesium_polylepis.1
MRAAEGAPAVQAGDGGGKQRRQTTDDVPGAIHERVITPMEDMTDVDGGLNNALPGAQRERKPGEYEAERHANIERNNEFLRENGLLADG